MIPVNVFYSLGHSIKIYFSFSRNGSFGVTVALSWHLSVLAIFVLNENLFKLLSLFITRNYYLSVSSNLIRLFLNFSLFQVYKCANYIKVLNNYFPNLKSVYNL